jgi:hypothetical protein
MAEDSDQISSKASRRAKAGEPPNPDEQDRGHHSGMLMMRILGPMMTFVDRPWKVGEAMMTSLRP